MASLSAGLSNIVASILDVAAILRHKRLCATVLLLAAACVGLRDYYTYDGGIAGIRLGAESVSLSNLALQLETLRARHELEVGGIANLMGYLIGAYALVIGTGYLVQLGVAVRVLRRRRGRSLQAMIAGVGQLPRVALLLPAHREEAAVEDTCRALAKIDYSHDRLMVVIVDDGSTDGTLPKLIERCDAEWQPMASDVGNGVPAPPLGGRWHGRLRTETGEECFPVVIGTQANAGKAAALNQALNLTTPDWQYVLLTDFDAQLAPDAVKQFVADFLQDSRMVAAGGRVCFREPKPEYGGRTSPFYVWQTIEYVRSFAIGRVFWARFNWLPVISGAMGMFRREDLVAVQGNQPGCDSEDLALTVRLHLHHLSRGTDYIVGYVPEAKVFTDAPLTPLAKEPGETYLRGYPSTIRRLCAALFNPLLRSQRERWQRGGWEVVRLYWGAVLDGRFRGFGLVAMAYTTFVELLSPLVELLGVWCTLFLASTGAADPATIALLYALAVGLGTVISLAAVLVEGRLLSAVDVPAHRLLLCALAEWPYYHPLTVLWRCCATADCLSQSRTLNRLPEAGWVPPRSEREHDVGQGPGKRNARQAHDLSTSMSLMCTKGAACGTRIAVGRWMPLAGDDGGVLARLREQCRLPIWLTALLRSVVCRGRELQDGAVVHADPGDGTWVCSELIGVQTARRSADSCCIVAVGALCKPTVAKFRAEMAAHAGAIEGTGPISVDISRLEYIDKTGLAALVSVSRDALERRQSLQFHGASKFVTRAGRTQLLLRHPRWQYA